MFVGVLLVVIMDETNIQILVYCKSLLINEYCWLFFFPQNV